MGKQKQILRNIWPPCPAEKKRFWIICLLSKSQMINLFSKIKICGFWSPAAWSYGNCTHVESTTYEIALQVELWVGTWKISNLFKRIKENKWAQPWSSSQLKCHEQHHLHSASPWTQGSAMLNCFTDPRTDRLTGSLLQSQVRKYQN